MGMEHYVRVRGLGGNSGAFLAMDRHTPGKRVVIKRLADGAQGMEELKASLSVQHPNIIHFFESFVYEGNLYVVLRHEAGGDMGNLLTKLLELHKLPTTHTLLMWYAQLLGALAHCHAQRIIHRDIKPSNIFVSEDTKTLYLGDFGSAKELMSSSLTSTFVGSPLWISPEVLQGKSYTFSSDIWSLGCVFYEMACLHHPFTGNCFARLVNEITTGNLAPLPAELPRIIKEVITRMLTLDPSERPTATEILIIVKGALEAEEIQKSSLRAPHVPKLSPRNLQLMTPRQGTQGSATKAPKPRSVQSPKIPSSVVKSRPQSKAICSFSRYMTTSVLSRSQEHVDSPPMINVTMKFPDPDDRDSAERERERHVSVPEVISPARQASRVSPVRVRSAEPPQQSLDIRFQSNVMSPYQRGNSRAGGRSTTLGDTNKVTRSGRDQRTALVHSYWGRQDPGAHDTEVKIALEEQQRTGPSEKSPDSHRLSPVLLVIPSSNKTRAGPRHTKKAPKRKPNVPTSSAISLRSHRRTSDLAVVSTGAVPLPPPYMRNVGTDTTSDIDRQLIKGQKCSSTRQTEITSPTSGHGVAGGSVEVLSTATPPIHQPAIEKTAPTNRSTYQRSERILLLHPEGACNGGVRRKNAVVSVASEPQGKASRSQAQAPPVARRAQAAAERNKKLAIPQVENIIPQRPRPQSSASLSAIAEQAISAREATRSVCQPHPRPTATTADSRNTSRDCQKKRWLFELNHDVTDIENYLCRFREHDQHVLHANDAAVGETKPLQCMERCESGGAKHSLLRQVSLLSLMKQDQSPARRSICKEGPPNKPNPSPLPRPIESSTLREEARKLAQEKREAQRAKLKELIREGRTKMSGGKALNRRKLDVEIKIPLQSGSKGNRLGCLVNCL